MIDHKIGLSGEGRCILYDNADDMNVVSDTGWFPNLITDSGLDIWHTGNAFNRTYVGSGTTPTTIGMTDMETYIPGGQSLTIGTGNEVRVAASAPNDWSYSETRSRRFIAGIGTGAINEIGMGSSIDDSGTNIFNRVVLGATINKTAQQVLDVIFRLTIWQPKDDVIGSSTINGLVYTTTTRLLDAAQIGNDTYDRIDTTGDGTSWRAYDGDLGVLTATNPQGANDDASDFVLTQLPYTPGDHFMEFTVDCGLNGWVLGGGLVRTVRGYTNHFTFQTQYEADIATGGFPKAATEIADLSWRISWDRRP